MAFASIKYTLLVGTLNCLLTLPMLVKKIWWVNCDKQHWEDEGTGQKWKKTLFAGSVPTIFVWDWSYDQHTECSTSALCSQEHFCHYIILRNCWSNEVALRKAISYSILSRHKIFIFTIRTGSSVVGSR